MENMLRMLTKNIVLIGFMGTGKTSVGKILGRKLNREVIDIDEWIERNQGKKIADIFEAEGEEKFRALEKEAIRQIAQKESVVITTGGGVVLDPENMTLLRQKGWIVALNAMPETIFSRVKHSKHRPLLKGQNMFMEIKRLLSDRKRLYDEADFSFDTDQKTASEVVEAILITLESNLT